MNLPTLPVSGVTSKFDFSKVQTVFAPAGAIIVSVIVLIFVVWPKISQVLSIRTENAQFTERIALLSAKVGILESLDKNILDQQLVAADRLIPSDKAVFAFVRQLETSASESGVVLSKVDVAPGALSGSPSTPVVTSPGLTPSQSAAPATAVENVEVASKIQVRISLTSDYKSFVSFIERVANLARVSAIGDLTIAAGGGGSTAAPLRSSMVIDAYWKALPSELGSIESSIEQLSESEVQILDRVRKLAVSEPAPSVPVTAGSGDLFAPF